MRLIIFILTTILAFASCAGGSNNVKSNNTKSDKESVALYVDTLHMQRQTFNKQIICNGRLRAVLKSDISFPKSGTISQILIKSGDDVAQGDLLSVLDTHEAEIELAQSQRSVEKAELELFDKLIGQGYNADTMDVPKPLLRNAKHSSGYNAAIDNFETSKRSLAECYIYAPFAGRIANLESKIYDKSGTVLCTLINDTYFDVEFNILEAELMDIAKGQAVNVTPFIDDDRVFDGVITEINPLIDDSGQIKVRAKVENRDHFLVEGMNVRLTLNRAVEDQYVVPKSSVVLRDGFNVIFKYVDGEAVWTYVTVVMSNLDYHLITGHKEKETELSEEDIIITSGNRNLADGVKVNIKEQL